MIFALEESFAQFWRSFWASPPPLWHPRTAITPFALVNFE